MPVAWARRAAALVPDGRLRVLPDCGHWPPRERPAAFVRAIEGFLGGSDGFT